ncbi:hypothetical protein [Paraburkholderia flava]|uniref:hypothetical protein n=1 Tax=Paraburkholderia flava TaxID=2547393 RepID=UPI00105ED137|nr:hypothetical protein [Paraburkholderia flava]
MADNNAVVHGEIEPGRDGEAQGELVSDDESLYRRAPKTCVVYESGVERISSSAFNDRGHKPSVDRACMRRAPEESKADAADGILEILAAEVRAIRDIEITNPASQPPAYYAVDVHHRPIIADEATATVANPAHAQIEARPHAEATSRFKKIKEALALIANSRGWLIRPE